MIEEGPTAEIVHAIRVTGLSEGVHDTEGRPVNIVDTTADIAEAIRELADAVRELAEQTRAR